MTAEEPVWLKRHRELERLAETVQRLKRVHIYGSEEIVKIVGERYRRLKPRRPGKSGRIELELKRVETVYNVARDRLRRALDMPPLHELSDFHRVLVESYVGSERYQQARTRVARSLRLLREFWNQYRWLIATSRDVREAAKLRKEASGRMLSVVRRLGRDLDLLRRVREELVRTHVVAEGLPIAVVAGIPSSGKSTLVSSLSTAEPEIAAYPFTTKTIIVGKVVDTDVAYYLVDTPGVLERPPEKLNEIERKALVALSTLPDVIVFVIDPSPHQIQSLESQLRLLESIVENIAGKRDAGLIVAVNKADITPKEKLEEVLELVNNTLQRIGQAHVCYRPLVVSAADGRGLAELKEALKTCVKEKADWLYAATRTHSKMGRGASGE